ncbi:putative membrane protein [Streptococcus infantarius subsp. infantarius]|nr:putative membrane protein [Streptococcus infantarius subsp. infantarius]
MKIGIRTPNLKKSIKARTTGKIKRKMKSAVNPLYGKKGMGMITNPKKAVYNKVYNKTTIDPLKSIKTTTKSKKRTLSAKTVPVQSVSIPSVTKTVTYTCNKWIYIFLALMFGIFGAQYFYSGQKQKGILSLLFCWTSIPMVIGIFQAFATLFKSSDQNGNISFVVTEHAKPSDAVADCDKVQQLLSEIEVLEPTLKTTLDPEEYISTVKKISDNLNEVTNFSRTYAKNPNFNAQSMANALETMVQGLDEEEENFIRRYHSENPTQDGREKLSAHLEFFSPNAAELTEQLYK